MQNALYIPELQHDLESIKKLGKCTQIFIAKSIMLTHLTQEILMTFG